MEKISGIAWNRDRKRGRRVPPRQSKTSASDVGADKDSLKRQREAVTAYATANGIEGVQEYYYADVSGAGHINERPGSSDMFSNLHGNTVDKTHS